MDSSTTAEINKQRRFPKGNWQVFGFFRIMSIVCLEKKKRKRPFIINGCTITLDKRNSSQLTYEFNDEQLFNRILGILTINQKTLLNGSFFIENFGRGTYNKTSQQIRLEITNNLFNMYLGNSNG